MKTSNKTNIRFSGFVVILVLSLVAANLTAQKSYRNFALASLVISFFETNKYNILYTETATKIKLIDADKDPIEDWMIKPMSLMIVTK